MKQSSQFQNQHSLVRQNAIRDWNLVIYFRTVIYLLTSTPKIYIFPNGNMNTISPKQLGATIRARRKRLKVTQKDLALTCGTGLRFIIDLEKGKPTCQIGKILQVIQALGLKLQISNPGLDTDQDEKS